MYRHENQRLASTNVTDVYYKIKSIQCTRSWIHPVVFVPVFFLDNKLFLHCQDKQPQSKLDKRVSFSSLVERILRPVVGLWWRWLLKGLRWRSLIEWLWLRSWHQYGYPLWESMRT